MSIYTDYSYEAEQGIGMGLSILGSIAIFGVITFILTIVISVLMIIAQWKIFTKLGKKGWISLIPFYNTWVLFETQGIKGWWSLIPIANIVFMYIAYYKLAISFGKSTIFAILTIFFPYICLLILAFSKEKKNETPNSNNQTTSTESNMNNFVNNQSDINSSSIQPNEQANIQNINNETVNNMQQENVNNGLDSQQINEQTQQNIEQNTMVKFCTNCGNQVRNDSAFCTNCGTRL